jgi:hypothetical protein
VKNPRTKKVWIREIDDLFNEILYELINMNYTIVSIHCIVYEEN